MWTSRGRQNGKATVLRELVDALRAAAPEVTVAVWHRLEDRALLEREDVRAGLAAMHVGDVVEAEGNSPDEGIDKPC